MKINTESIYIQCPVCYKHNFMMEDHDGFNYRLLEVELFCNDCQATFTAHFECYKYTEVRHGEPIGPSYVTDDPCDALQAWYCDEYQMISSNSEHYVVGYERTIFDKEGSKENWFLSSPEELVRLF